MTRIGRPPAGGGVIVNHRTHYPALCEQCGQEYLRQQNKPERRFCSPACASAVNRGEKVWHLYKHGQSHTATYRDEKHRKERLRWPEKTRARMALITAVRNCRIVRPDHCLACGKVGPVQGHHDDYSKPLEVRWVCVRCHADIHRDERVLIARRA